jgi:hypothetical protein
MKKAILIVLLMLVAHSALSKTITVKISDLDFEQAKKILLFDKSYANLSDDILQQILNNKGTLTFDDGLLPQDVRTRLDAAQKVQTVTTTLQQTRDWAEMGNAVGIATRGALSAITDETEKFAKTTPGLFLMAIVAWKVAGADFLATIKGYLIGVPLLIFWIWFFARWFNRIYFEHWVTTYVANADGTQVKTKVEVQPLSVQWTKEWGAAKAAAKEPDKMGMSDMAILAGFKTAGFIVGIFAIVWLII